jgi:hypothetical protein
MIRVRLTLEPDGATCLESPYDPVLVDGLKRAVEYSGRQWDASRKRWIISALYADDLVRFLTDFGAQIQDDRAPAPTAVMAPPPMPPDLKEAFDALFLAYTAPLCVAEASHKALVKYHHPDHGGAVEDFHVISDAIAVIRHYLDPKPEEQEDDDAELPF